jgi:amino acid adenylation domain-containing protein
MLVALLGVLKAGAAYVPLDPAFPVDRLHFMLADSDCGVVVTQSSLTGLVGAWRRVLLLDALDDTVPPAGVTDLAYVIYTSGSTGVPKGVLIEHGALSNFLQSMAAEPGCAAGDVLVAVTTLSFDIAALELFLPLVTGATVVIVRRETATDPAALAAALKRHGATIMQATPSTWRMLVDDGWAGRPGLRMLCGGEALPATLAGALLPLGRELWNMYGPTETTIWSSVDHVRPGRPIRLGRPVLNTDLLVVDGHRQPVPAGVAGELLIGGLGLARGYHNRAELTADRFVEHPLAPGARAYRTGDLVRTRRDGEIEFLGRMDHQVKVRGFRIELGEVEVAIAAHPAVRDVVVVVREDVPGDQLLVGYAVGDVDGPELRAFVGTRLPSYMVPSVIMVLDELPRTSNGKTDRKGLPAPEIAVASAAEFVAPRGPVEEAVADMWCTVLRLDQVSVLDDFFTVGGHSLRIAQVLSRVRQTFGVDLTLHEVYERPTVAAMAQAITLRLIDDPELAELMAQVEGTDGSDA